MVYVQGPDLVVSPKFPFNLAFLPEIYGLDLRVPIASITEVEKTDHLFGRCLRISFAKSGPPAIELQLRDEAGLIHYLGRATAADQEPAASPKLRKSWRLTFFRVFAAIWGTGVLIGAFSGLPEDYRFRHDGIEVTGIVDGIDNSGKPRAILSYSVGDQRYHLSPIFGSDTKIGDTGRLFYLPADPGQARDADFLVFDLGALGLGLLAVTASIFGGTVARRLS